MARRLTGALVLVAVLGAAAGADDGAPGAAASRTVRHRAGGFRLEIPTGWGARTDLLGVSAAPEAGGALVRAEATGEGAADLDEAEAALQRRLERSVEGWNLLAREDVTVAGRAGRHLRARGQRGGRPLLLDYDLVLAGGRVHVLAFARREDVPAERLAEAEGIRASWRIGEEEGPGEGLRVVAAPEGGARLVVPAAWPVTHAGAPLVVEAPDGQASVVVRLGPREADGLDALADEVVRRMRSRGHDLAEAGREAAPLAGRPGLVVRFTDRREGARWLHAAAVAFDGARQLVVVLSVREDAAARHLEALRRIGASVELPAATPAAPRGGGPAGG